MSVPKWSNRAQKHEYLLQYGRRRNCRVDWSHSSRRSFQHNGASSNGEYLLKWVLRTRGAISRGKPRLPSSLSALLYAVFIATVLWGLIKVNGYQVSVPFLCSYHSPLSFDKPLPPDLSPWIDLLSIEDDMFGHLLKEMVIGYSMSMDVIDAQLKTRDVRTLSSRSQKDLLVNDLSALLSERSSNICDQYRTIT